MARRGYSGEYRVKQKLKTIYGDCIIIKAAIGQKASDYIIIKPLMAVGGQWAVCAFKGAEVKSTKKKQILS